MTTKTDILDDYYWVTAYVRIESLIIGDFDHYVVGNSTEEKPNGEKIPLQIYGAYIQTLDENEAKNIFQKCFSLGIYKWRLCIKTSLMYDPLAKPFLYAGYLPNAPSDATIKDVSKHVLWRFIQH